MQCFAIIPAAGLSQRMGQPKLLLPWGNATVIEHVVAVWRASRVDRVLIIIHPQDAQLAALAAAAGAVVIQPETAPAEMKASVQVALAAAEQFQPQASDTWLLAPADMPGLTAADINRVIDAYRNAEGQGENRPRIWVPRYGGRRGHPVLFAWSMAAEVPRLAENEGLNALVDRNPVAYVDVADDGICHDFDTPADYQQLRARYGR